MVEQCPKDLNTDLKNLTFNDKSTFFGFGKSEFGLRGEIIEIAKYLKEMHSECKYVDYFNVFKKRNKDYLWQKIDIPRLMRKMKEQGVFLPFYGRFILR